MRIGVCLLTLATEQDSLASYSIPSIASAGYDYAEVSLAKLLPLEDSEIEAYRAKFDECGVPVEVFNNALPAGLQMVGPNVEPQKVSAYIEKAIHVAQIMGVSLITMCGPIRDWAPQGFSWREGLPQYVDFLRAFGDRAAEAGITLAIEPINQEEHGFIATVGDALEAIGSCGRENVKLMVDFYHFFRQGDDWNVLLDNCKENLVHVHYATQSLRNFPLERDWEECASTLRPLLAAGYQGRISLEAHVQDFPGDLAETNRVLKSIFSSAEED